MSWAERVAGMAKALSFSPRSQVAALATGLARAWPWFLRDDGAAARSATTAGQRTYALIGTTHFRQASSFAFVLLLVTLGSIVWGQSLLEQLLTSHVKDMVEAEVRTQYAADGLGDTRTLAANLQHREAAMVQRPERAIVVQAPDGSPLLGSPELLSAHMCPSAGESCIGWLRTRNADNAREWFGLAYALPDGGRYVIAYDILPMLDRIYPVPLAAGASVFFALLISLGIGLNFSLNKVRRVDLIRRVMARFAHGNMEARVPVGTGAQDEFDHLGDDINQALQRVSRLVEEVRNATNHIAHELRTPLARLQQRLSNMAPAAHDNAEVAGELAQAEEEAQRIQYLFRAVMRISEIETGRCAQESKVLDVPELFNDLSDYYDVLAEERSVKLEGAVEPGLQVVGDRALLFQALVNLVDNAIKYTPAGSTVSLVARTHGVAVELCVADQGPGIDAALRSRAVQRFQRLTRDRSIPGHGLGLALVQAVAELHGGTLTLQDNDRQPHISSGASRGLMVTLRLPQPIVAAYAPNVNDS